MSYICKLDSKKECDCCHLCGEPVKQVICDICSNVITEDYYYRIDGLTQCESCVNKEYLRYIGDE